MRPSVLALAPPATEHWELIEPRAGFHLQVTVPGHRRPGPSGIFVHRTNRLLPDEVSEKDGIPITSPARTLFDFTSQASRSEVAGAYEQGLIRKLFDRDEMIVLALRHKGRRGIRKIRELIDRDAPPTVTIKEAHRRLLELVRSSGLPHPKTEVPIGGYRVDMLWPDALLVIEMDSTKWHSIAGKLEGDKRRDAELAAMGYLTIRVTWNELVRRPNEVIARIAQTYALRKPSPSRSILT